MYNVCSNILISYGAHIAANHTHQAMWDEQGKLYTNNILRMEIEYEKEKYIFKLKKASVFIQVKKKISFAYLTYFHKQNFPFFPL